MRYAWRDKPRRAGLVLTHDVTRALAIGLLPEEGTVAYIVHDYYVEIANDIHCDVAGYDHAPNVDLSI